MSDVTSLISALQQASLLVNVCVLFLTWMLSDLTELHTFNFVNPILCY